MEMTKLKWNLIKAKSIQVFMIMKYVKKVLINWFCLQNYYPQVFSEECKYIFKEKKISRSVNDDLEISSDRSDESDEKVFDKEADKEEILMREVIILVDPKHKIQMNLAYLPSCGVVSCYFWDKSKYKNNFPTKYDETCHTPLLYYV